MRKQLKCLLALVLAVVTVCSAAAPAMALTPTYRVTKAYEASRYYKELLEVELIASRYNEDLETKAYDSVTKEQVEAMSLAEKMAETRKYREGEYEKLINAVYPKRGWTMNGVPTIEHLKKIGMDLPELIEIVEPLQNLEP